jgi:hypothetical protein
VVAVITLVVLVQLNETAGTPVLEKPTVLQFHESRDLNHWSKNNCLSADALYPEQLLLHPQKLTVV